SVIVEYCSSYYFLKTLDAKGRMSFLNIRFGILIGLPFMIYLPDIIKLAIFVVLFAISTASVLSFIYVKLLKESAGIK
ncbi:hypothetical protein, partial [Sphingomonas sp. ERG5]|uniref:hypothetical protein n=1 Tax=Sphingomonas sp. ERG5 TaxID=1381597 RepID=UPI001F2042F7